MLIFTTSNYGLYLPLHGINGNTTNVFEELVVASVQEQKRDSFTILREKPLEVLLALFKGMEIEINFFGLIDEAFFKFVVGSPGLDLGVTYVMYTALIETNISHARGEILKDLSHLGLVCGIFLEKTLEVLINRLFVEF